MEKRAARIIGPSFKVPYVLSTRRVTGGLAFIHKLMRGHGSNELKSMLPPLAKKSRYLLRSETVHHEFTLSVPFCRTEQRKRSFSIRYSGLWNALPASLVKSGINTKVFKTSVSMKPP